MTTVIELDDYRAPTRLPQPLKSLKCWLVWRLVQMPGEPKPRKVPYYANGNRRSGQQGSDEDRNQMVTFERAVVACVKGDYSGVGLAIFPDAGIVALDFDDCVEDGEIDPKVLELVEGTYAEFSPSGRGVRAFYAGSLPSKKDLDGSPKVEVFGTSGFVTVTGKVIPECELFGFGETLADLSGAVQAMYQERFGAPVSAGDDWLLTLSPKAGVSLDDAQAMLDRLDPDLGYQDWLGVGQGLHHEFDGSDEALALFDAWSAKGSKYAGRKAVEAKWASFGRYGGSPRTLAWVIKKTGIDSKYEALEAFKRQINESTSEIDLRERICKAIVEDSRIDEMGREALAQALREKFKGLGTSYPIGVVRKLLEKSRQKVEGKAPPWSLGWYYVTDDDKFFRYDSDEWLTKQGFDAKFNRYMPRDEFGNVVGSASAFVLEDGHVEVVTRAMYLPWASARFEFSGVECINAYRPSTVPEAASAIKTQAVDCVMAHIRSLCGGRAEVVDSLVAWMAHNVQRPGVKIRWSPLIKGIEGDGKSILANLLAAVMGRANVRNISPKVLGTDFTGWAEGACVGALEEIKLTGHNRYDILNALKPFITNDSVEIHRKGQDTYDTVNTMNYIAFTNFSDALPLDDRDRRWFIVFTPWSDAKELPDASYYARLSEAINNDRASLRSWLLSVDLSSFDANGRAPETDEKLSMVRMNEDDEEQTLREVIEQGGPGITRTVLCSSSLSASLMLAGVELRTRALNHALKRLGWVQFPRVLFWNGKARRVWVRGRITDKGEVTGLLDASLPVEDVADLF